MIWNTLAEATLAVVRDLYGVELRKEDVQIQKTRKEFDGELTLVVFPFTKMSRKGPEATATEIGESLLQRVSDFSKFSVVKGFLNLEVKDEYWLDFLYREALNEKFGLREHGEESPLLIEFSSPNTNKPLHLGHIRNNLLGASVANILEAAGHPVIRVNLVNDRGIHICKSMLAWQKWGKGETPENSGKKGDHLVGDYYVLFDKKSLEDAIEKYNRIFDEAKRIISDSVGQQRTEPSPSEVISQTRNKIINQFSNYNLTPEDFAIITLKADFQDNEPIKSIIEKIKVTCQLYLEAQEMLRKWESGDQEVRKLWEMMNQWVYQGFDETYQRLGIKFDKTYFESDTYLLGKEMVMEGVKNNTLVQKEDSSVWADLTDLGLDEKLLLRSDGTSVYMTQDLGTARLRFNEYQPQRMIYVVGNEQNYHFDVLKKVLAKLGFLWAESIHHLSYGMVELPAGKMKSREGTVVDADELMDEMADTARQVTEELGKTDGFVEAEANELYHMIGQGALKYFILKVDPDKNMMFNPEESIDFDGNTGPFIQYTHARICSLLRKASESDKGTSISTSIHLLPEEREILSLCHDFPAAVQKAAEELSPAQIANYTYELTRAYNTFYQKIPVLKENNEEFRRFRLKLTALCGQIIHTAMGLLGINVPERM